MRGDGDSTDDLLPPSPPKFTFKHQVYDTPTRDETKNLDFEESKENKLLTLDSSVTRYTRFESSAAPAKVVDRISEVISTMGGKTAPKSNFKIKAQFGATAFFVQVFGHPSDEKKVVADFRKQQGTGVEFRNLYQEIRAQLADIVLQPVSKSSESTETSQQTSS